MEHPTPPNPRKIPETRWTSLTERQDQEEIRRGQVPQIFQKRKIQKGGFPGRRTRVFRKQTSSRRYVQRISHYRKLRFAFGLRFPRREHQEGDA